MLEILYRIYQVSTTEEAEMNNQTNLNFGFSNSISKAQNIEILMDCLVCDSREQFKEIIKSEYGNNISFRYSKKLQAGELYCVIIGEHCYDTEKYFTKVEYTCSYCGAKATTYIKKLITIDNYEINHNFYGIEEYRKMVFCSYQCKNRFVEAEQKKLKPDSENDFFVSRDMFTEKISGYIYKITKKSSGEFYIGQTVYAPIFRWGQHLKTERFDIKDILDYQFETIEIVPKGENILEREKYYIQKHYKENPSLSLNISQTANIDQICIDEIT